MKLGAIGLGSSNDFHKPFKQENLIENIPALMNFSNTELRDVCRIVYKKKGVCFAKYFVINSSIGITAEGNRFFNEPDFILKYLKKSSTSLAIIYAALRQILKHQNIRINVNIDDEPSRKLSVSNLGIVKNPHFSGNMSYGGSPQYSNGLIKLVCFEDMSKLELLKILLDLSNGKLINHNKVFKHNAKRVTITSDKDLSLEFDGEIIMSKEINFSILPRKIGVCKC